MRDERQAELDKAAGNALRILRKSRGWSKARLGHMLGVPPEIITAYEAGEASIPSAQLLIVDKYFHAGGLDFWFWPHSRPDLQGNVIRFPHQ